MKGFIGVKGIFILVALIVLFGGAMYDVTTTGVRCALGTAGRGNYTCDDFGLTIGSVFVSPDRNIGSGVDSILILREFQVNDPEEYENIKELVTTDEQGYRNQIFIGLAGLIVLIGFLIYLMMKATPSSIIHIDSKFASIMLAFLIYVVVYLAYTGLYEGNAQMPFTGLMSLISHTDVLMNVVDYTALLPGTLTTGDIVDGGLEVT
jgi:hypothetical protein